MSESQRLLLAAQSEVDAAKRQERAISARNREGKAALKELTERISAGQRAYELLSQALSNAQQRQQQVAEVGNAEDNRLQELKSECETLSKQTQQCKQKFEEQQAALQETTRAVEVESTALNVHKERLGASRAEWQDLEQRKAECQNDLKELRETAQVRIKCALCEFFILCLV